MKDEVTLRGELRDLTLRLRCGELLLGGLGHLTSVFSFVK